MIDKADLTKLERLLEDVRTTLRSGDYQQLAALATEQERMIGRLQTQPQGTAPDKGLPARIADAARRNQRLIEAAMEGFRSAARRRNEILAAQQPIKTYDRSGQKTSLESDQATLEKRS
ncbi:MAG: hypothetical protein KDA67_12620 [Rhodobacteraceae bacterium]|nr:hypothetical protein [Paracoccaceae bacterium]